MGSFSPTWYPIWLHGKSYKSNLRMMANEVVSWLHYPPCTNKKGVNKNVDDIDFLERIEPLHLQNWPIQLMNKLIWTWWCSLWTILPVAWNAFPSFHWSSWLCCLSSHLKATRNRVCRELLEQCQDLEESKVNKCLLQIFGEKDHFMHIHKADKAQILRKLDASKNPYHGVLGDDSLK